MVEEIGHSRLSYRGQIVVPKNVKEYLNAHDGDYIIFYKDDDGRIFIRLGVLRPKE